VIEGASTIDVVYEENSTFVAELLGTDSTRDIALLRICCNPSFEALEYSNQGDVKLGESVVALGFPLGVNSLRVSQGIISGLQFSSLNDRQEIQTDAAINQGNSGGPLLLMNGTIAGINTYGIRESDSGAAVEGFGFAVSSETITSIAPLLVIHTQVAAPTPTPHPSIINGVFTTTTFGSHITPPEGWDFEVKDDGILMWDRLAGLSLRVTESVVDSIYWNSGTVYSESWTIVAAEGWTDFVIEKEETIYRTRWGGSGDLLEGHQFTFKFKSDGVVYDAVTQWFILGARKFQIDLQTPTTIWQLPEYAEIRRELQLASASFQPQ